MKSVPVLIRTKDWKAYLISPLYLTSSVDHTVRSVKPSNLLGPIVIYLTS